MSVRTLIFLTLLTILIHTRFIGLQWGLPYPMHPDERNMANAIQQLSCTEIISESCFNPHFFAYGQFPLYLSYIFIKLFHGLLGNMSQPTLFEETTMALRSISAVSSVFTVYILLVIVQLIQQVKKKQKLIVKEEDPSVESSPKNSLKELFILRHSPFSTILAFVLFIFSPVLIQFAHFGTTESLLMLFYSIVVFLSLALLYQYITIKSFVRFAGITCGIALGTKVSAAVFIFIPLLAILWYSFTHKSNWWFLKMFFRGIRFFAYTMVFFIITSPYNIVDYKNFLGAITYESSIGFGEYVPFYTKQFVMTTPIVFQFFHIFPYTLGWIAFVLFLLGFFLLPWKKDFIFLRIAFLFVFLPNAFVFAKWTRFIAPAYPMMMLFSALFLIQLYEFLKGNVKKKQVIQYGMFFFVLMISLPGIAYLSVYRNSDIRFVASRWMMNNIPANAYILSETANVVDIPIPDPTAPIDPYMQKNFTNISFNFYDLDENPLLLQELERHIQQADYIIVPSRRIFSNHTCIFPTENGYIEQSLLLHSDKRCAEFEKKYPKLNDYYRKLFSGELGFEHEVTFTSYPRISLFEKTLYEIQDENAEETWTVFDHPVIRIYKRVNN